MDSFFSLSQFLALTLPEVANIVRASQTKVCVFPFNGTRRWFLLEHGRKAQGDFARVYLEETSKAYIKLFQMLFDHGFESVLAPLFGTDVLERGEEYMSQIGTGMVLPAEYPDFLSFYRDYDVRVFFYGDYRARFDHTPYEFITKAFDKVTASTSSNNTHKLFFGVFANEAIEATASLTLKFYEENHKLPARQDLIRMYYGDYIERVDLFIGFERFTCFDYPMLGWGGESLYFTTAPSLYMTESLLRRILYDHIYLRPIPEPDYSKMPQDAFERMRRLYADSQDVALGTGHLVDNIWHANFSTQSASNNVD